MFWLVDLVEMWKSKLVEITLPAWKEDGEEEVRHVHFATMPNENEGFERFPDIAEEDLHEAKGKTVDCNLLHYLKMKMKKDKGFSVQRKRSGQHSSSLGAGGDSSQDKNPSPSTSGRPLPNSKWKTTQKKTKKNSAPEQAVARPKLVPLVVKFRTKEGDLAMAAYSIPITMTFREFLQESILQLRRQSSSPKHFPCQILLNEFVRANWHHKHQDPVDARFAEELFPGNWQRCMKLYSAHLQPKPLEIQLMISPKSPSESDQGTSGQGTSGQGTPGQGTSCQGISGQGISGQGTSGQGASGQGTSGGGQDSEDPDAITQAPPLPVRKGCDAFGNEY
ncbi:MAG: hypothetical protein Q9184_004945 [Pyrenodesmia sp. 2 TL-2023]